MEHIEEFGKYRLIRPLAQGGMAQLFLAKHVGPGGFEKTVAVKRVLPHLAEDSDLINMFLDEARLASRLNHPNVVQVFDFGEAEGTYYLAMEYLEGSDVSSLMRAVKKLGQVMPAQLAAIIASEAAAGLHHAHTLVGDDGSPYNIVHRDVSPSNIFVTRSGTVKVLDFGIARAEGRLVRTQTGILKGKAPYMPPEQLNGATLDARADVYALGCTLHEMLTGARLFKRDTEANTLMAILREPVHAPRELRPEIPEALSEVAMVAIERDREQRYGSALEMREALEDYLSTCSYAPVQRLLTHFLDSLEKGQVPKGNEGARRPTTGSVRRQSGELLTPSGNVRKPATGSNAKLVPGEEPKRSATGSNARVAAPEEQPRRAPTGSTPRIAPEEQPRRAPTGSIPRVAPEEQPRRAPTGSIPRVAPEEQPRRAPTGSNPRLATGSNARVVSPPEQPTRANPPPPVQAEVPRWANAGDVGDDGKPTIEYNVSAAAAGARVDEEAPVGEEEAGTVELQSMRRAAPPAPSPQSNSKVLIAAFVGLALLVAVAVALASRGDDRSQVDLPSVPKGDGSKLRPVAGGGLPPIPVKPVETSVGDRPNTAPEEAPAPPDGQKREPDSAAAIPDGQPSAAQPAPQSDAPKPAPPGGEPKPPDARPRTGALSVNCVPWCKVFLDGKDTKRTSPAEGIVLSAGRHALKVVNPDTGLEMERSISIRAGGTTQEIFKF